MAKFLKILFFALLIKPIVLLFLGLNVKGRENLSSNGPNILVANHNSHLDTLVILSLFPLRKIANVRPVAAADYFLKNRLVAWFSIYCIGIIPIERGGSKQKDALFEQCVNALNSGEVLVLFPEGTRGEPEQLQSLKKGAHHLASLADLTYVTPVVTHGLGRALPKGEGLFVPFNCDVVVDEPMGVGTGAKEFVDLLSQCFESLQQQCLTKHDDSCD